jgi:hypothetical protein
MIAGDVGAVTMRRAALLVVFPPVFETTQRKSAPLSAMVVAGVVYEALIAPPMSELFFCHW